VNSTEIMSTENREKLKNYVTKTEKIPKNDNYVALIVMSSTVLQRILRNTYCQEFIAYCIMGMTLDISKPLRILCLHSPRITS
jgi:hypothetical protein